MRRDRERAAWAREGESVCVWPVDICWRGELVPEDWALYLLVVDEAAVTLYSGNSSLNEPRDLQRSETNDLMVENIAVQQCVASSVSLTFHSGSKRGGWGRSREGGKGNRSKDDFFQWKGADPSILGGEGKEEAGGREGGKNPKRRT